jgi:hypothetical protein
MASKTIHKEKRGKAVSIVAALAILFTAFLAVYYFTSKASVAQSEDVRQKAADFYTDFIYQINTNEDWAGFLDKYTTGEAKEKMSDRALELLHSAENGSQYIVRLMSPIEAETYEINGKSAKVFVNFDFGERIAGDAEKLSIIKKYLTFEKLDGDWVISEIFDRSDRFDEAINK